MSTNPSGCFFQSGNISWSRHRFSYCCRVFAYAYGSHEWTRYSTRMTPERGTYCIGCGRNALREKTTDSEWSNMKPCFFPISCSDSRFSLFGNGSLELWFWVFTYHLVEARCPPPPNACWQLKYDVHMFYLQFVAHAEFRRSPLYVMQTLFHNEIRSEKCWHALFLSFSPLLFFRWKSNCLSWITLNGSRYVKSLATVTNEITFFPLPTPLAFKW